jgi:redox-sensing transcriptional repressor
MNTKSGKGGIKRIPGPALSRLCKIYGLLEELGEKGEMSVSSKYIGKRLGVGPHNIRKDMGYIGEAGTSGSGYGTVKLKAHIEEVLGLKKKRNACIIGLGTLGVVILNYQKTVFPDLCITAGFDSNVNKLETIQISIPVYPTYEISEVVKRDRIELAVITEPVLNIEKIPARLIQGGIRGIINFTPINLELGSAKVHIRNIDIVSEIRYLSALLNLSDTQ